MDNNSVMKNISVELSSQSSGPELKVALEMRSVYIWVLVAVGLPTNAACLVTVLFMRVTTATFYVALLALADSLALVVKLIYHQLQITNARLCFSQHVNHFCSCYANWVLVLITFQRCYAVCRPLKTKAVFTKVRICASAVIMAVGLFVIIVVPSFFLVEWADDETVMKKKCKELDEMLYFNRFILTPVYFFIPFFLISVFITLTVLALKRHRSAMLEFHWDSNSAAGGSCAERDVSIMLVCAGAVFLVLTLPTCVYSLYKPAPGARTYLIYQVVTLLADSNHAVNFFVYVFSASRFRGHFASLMCRLATLSPSVARGATRPPGDGGRTHTTRQSSDPRPR